ncbi:MAG: flagellar assembly protein FliH [Piscirickettsiaceae bacterium]|nr:MAG: flagellar assembly protein FliH [Piscirickettsiaceae bacterium]
MSKSSSDKGGVSSWQFPSFAQVGSADVAIDNVRALTASDVEKIQFQAQQEAAEKGYQEGLEKGFQAGEKQVAAKAAQLQTLLQSMSMPLEELDERVEQELVSLAIQIAKQLIRRELKADSGQVVAVTKEAIAALPSSSQNIELHLHPEDATLVRSALSLDGANEDRWKVVEDPVITRGGCRVTTDASTIDASIENRLAAIIAKGLGDERGSG